MNQISIIHQPLKIDILHAVHSLTQLLLAVVQGVFGCDGHSVEIMVSPLLPRQVLLCAIELFMYQVHLVDRANLFTLKILVEKRML